MRAKSGSQGQFKVIVDYMERHGDICGSRQTLQTRKISNRKWQELTDILNSKFENDTKSLTKWRKAWSDYKSNTQKKYAKMRLEGGELALSDLEKRVLQILSDTKNKNKKFSCSFDEEPIIKIDNDSNEESRSPTSSPTPSPTPGLVCTNEASPSPSRKNSVSSSSSEASSSSNKPQPKKRKIHIQLKEIERFIEYERDREKMAHEREMARLKQNDKLLSVVNRMVNVFETLVPSIQKFLDRSNSVDGLS